MERIGILSTPLAIASCTGFTATYVGILYCFKATRVGSGARDENGFPLTRDHPRVIKTRLFGVGLSTLTCMAGVWSLARRIGIISSQSSTGHQIGSTLDLLGINAPKSVSSSILTILAPLGLTASLFIGPLYVSFLNENLPGMRNFNWSRDVTGRFTSGMGFRNYIAAPITEELVFRACINTVGIMAGETKSQIIFLSPLYFGLAHIHHAYETYVNGGRTRDALIRGITASVVQFSYTYLMGIYGSFLFLRTSNLIPPVVGHAFCNIMGLPPLGESLQAFPHSKFAIWSAYGTGVLTFSSLLFRLTRPSLFGGSPYW